MRAVQGQEAGGGDNPRPFQSQLLPLCGQMALTSQKRWDREPNRQDIIKAKELKSDTHTNRAQHCGL